MVSPVLTQRTYLNDLNARQKEAVLATEGPVLVLAGAGTGKTRTLTARLAHILATERAWPSQVLAVTFTNKAAQEMRGRVEAAIQVHVPWLGTFHALCARLLRRHAEAAGLQANFTILDTADQERLLKELIRDANIDEKRWPARHLATVIERWKNLGLEPAEISKEDSELYAHGQGQKLYTSYQERLRELNAADFGDLLLLSVRLLRDHRSILEESRKRFKYILVDEYQDTNTVQYLWLRLLAQGRCNICCVGDDDQSIYGWRGAEVNNILRFESDFPGAQIIRLEENYRSTPHILKAASAVIAANKARLGKTLWTKETQGQPLILHTVLDEKEEARIVGGEIESLLRQGHRPCEIAILVRASSQMRAFEERFLETGLGYRVVGGLRFYEREEIRDANAYLRLAVRPQDDLAFGRILNKPRRGLGTASQQAIHTYARAQGLSLFAAAGNIPEKTLRPQARKALAAFLEMVQNWHDSRQEPHVMLAQRILEESGLLRMWEEDQSPEAPGKLENLRELLGSLKEYGGLEEYLEHIALMMEMLQEGEDRVNLMTMHAAKGLEFDTVFLPGWEEEMFPNARALAEDEERGGQTALEEERRLAYVALTRARQRVYLLHALHRRFFHEYRHPLPSRFLESLPPDCLERCGPSRPMGERIGAPPSEDSPGAWHIGQKVHHTLFGTGAIVAVEGDHLTIGFPSGTKTILSTFVEET